MEQFLKSLFDISKLPAKFFVLFSIVSGFILFVTDPILKLFHLEELVEKYGGVIGIIFLVSTGMVLINFILWIDRLLKTRNYKKNRAKKVENFIESMTASEQSLLREFMVQGMKTISAPVDDPTIAGMLHKDMLYIAMSFGNSGTFIYGTTTNISIHDDLLKLLNNKMVGIKDQPDEQDIVFINGNRPDWIPRYSNIQLNND